MVFKEEKIFKRGRKEADRFQKIIEFKDTLPISVSLGNV